MNKLEIASLCLYAVSAFCWIVAAFTRLTPIKKGIAEVDKLHLLSSDLQRAAKWSAVAAISVGVGLILHILAQQ
jgi:hypothetical protein